MNEDVRLSEIWNFVDQIRDNVNPSDYINELLSSELDIKWRDLHHFFSYTRQSPLILPNFVIDFLTAYINIDKPMRVLIPWCQSGVLPAALSEKYSIELLTVIIQQKVTMEIAKYLTKEKIIEWKFSDPLLAIDSIKRKYNFTISFPPFNNKLISKEITILKKQRTIKDRATNILILESINKLSDGGEAVFILPNSFPLISSRKIYPLIQKLNYSIHSIVCLPKNVMSPWTSIDFNIYFLNQNKKNKVFVSYLDPDRDFNELLEKINAYKTGARLDHGYFIEFSEFRSWNSIVLSEEVNAEAKKSNSNIQNLDDICKVINRGKYKKKYGGFLHDLLPEILL